MSGVTGGGYKIDAGSLRHKIEIQATTITTDGGGGGTEALATISGGTVWAAISHAGGGERSAAGQRGADYTHRIWIRYLSGVTTKHTVKFGSRYFDIVEVETPSEIPQWMVLHAIERRSD